MITNVIEKVGDAAYYVWDGILEIVEKIVAFVKSFFEEEPAHIDRQSALERLQKAVDEDRPPSPICLGAISDGEVFVLAQNNPRYSVGWFNAWALRRTWTINPHHPYSQIFRSLWMHRTQIEGGEDVSVHMENFSVDPLSNRRPVNPSRFLHITTTLLALQELTQNLEVALRLEGAIFAISSLQTRTLDSLRNVGIFLEVFREAEQNGHALEFFLGAFSRQDNNLEEMLHTVAYFRMHRTDFANYYPTIRPGDTAQQKVLEYYRVFRARCLEQKTPCSALAFERFIQSERILWEPVAEEERISIPTTLQHRVGQHLTLEDGRVGKITGISPRKTSLTIIGKQVSRAEVAAWTNLT